MGKATDVIFDKPWKQALVALIGLGLTYALASWAIDSGRLTAYFGAIIFTVFSIKHLIQAIKGYAGQK